MLSFERACSMAYNYFCDVNIKKGIDKAYESDNIWIFFGRNFEDGETEYGNTPISISKENGEGLLFHLGFEKNYETLESAKKVEVPKQYSI